MMKVCVRKIEGFKPFWTGEAPDNVTVRVYGVGIEWMQRDGGGELTITTSEECTVTQGKACGTLNLYPILPRKEPCYTGYAGKGNWGIENINEYEAKITCKGWAICTLWGGISHGGHKKEEIFKANTALVKAAPRMHKALKGLIGYMRERLADGDNINKDASEFLEAIAAMDESEGIPAKNE